MWPFKSKYDKLTREDVVDAICQLEKQFKEIKDEVNNIQKQIDDLMVKGKNEKSKDMRLFYVKEINSLKDERNKNIQRLNYILFNKKLLNKLKNAIDDKNFIKNTSNQSLGSLLKDQKGLTKFLSKILNLQTSAEDDLVDTDDIFNEFENEHELNDKIYGTNSNDDELLALFEKEDQVESEQEIHNKDTEKKEDNSDKGGD